MLNSIIPQLSVQELIDKLNNQQDITIIDIRDHASYKNGHISNAMHITQDNIAEFINNTRFDQAIVICCYKGYSSQQLARYLQGIGYTHLYNLVGGYHAWSENSLNG